MTTCGCMNDCPRITQKPCGKEHGQQPALEQASRSFLFIRQLSSHQLQDHVLHLTHISTPATSDKTPDSTSFTTL